MPLHVPVLLDEVLRFLDPQPGGRYIDATLGAGGHTAAILERSSPGGRVIGIDWDDSALEMARQSLRSFGSRLETVKSNFKHISVVADQHGFSQADGVLADVGVSSMMLDDSSRGFSFMREGELDMRMDQSQSLTAAEVLNTYPEKQLADIIFEFGEERRSRAISRSIVRMRPLRLTSDLVRAVENVMGVPRYGRIHPATRTFQALRIHVNDELHSLELFIDDSMTVLRPQGRLVVITFHSLEDRIVKTKFRTPAVCGKTITKKVVTASEEERRRNRRSRSAKLRVWERA